MGYHDDRGAQVVAQFQYQVVQPPRADRVEPRRWLIEKQDLRVQCHGACQCGTFVHATADFGRVEFLESGQPDQREFQRDDLGDLRRPQVCVFAQRQGDIFRQRQGTPQGAALEAHAEAALDALLDFRR